jgi:hypothetical protein
LPTLYAGFVLKLFSQESANPPYVYIDNPEDCHICFLMHVNTKLPWYINYFFHNNELSFFSEESRAKGITLSNRSDCKPVLASLIAIYSNVFNRLKNGWSFIPLNEEYNHVLIAKSIDLLVEEPTLIYFLLKKFKFDVRQINMNPREKENSDVDKLTDRPKIEVLYLEIKKDYYQQFKETLKFNIIS